MKLPEIKSTDGNNYEDRELALHSEQIAAQLTVAYVSQFSNPQYSVCSRDDVFSFYNIFLYKLNEGQTS